MNKAKVDEIMDKVVAAWKERYGEKFSQKPVQEHIAMLYKFLETCPDEDGKKRVSILGSKEVRLVPYSHIIINGLKTADLDKYPIEKVLGIKKKKKKVPLECVKNE